METSGAKFFILYALLIALTGVNCQGARTATVIDANLEVVDSDVLDKCVIAFKDCELDISLGVRENIPDPISLNLETEDENHRPIHSYNKELERPFEEIENQKLCVDYTQQEQDMTFAQGENILKGCNCQDIMNKFSPGVYHTKIIVSLLDRQICKGELVTKVE